MKKTIVILLALTTSAFAAKPQLPRLGLKSFDGWNKGFVTVRGTDKATVVSNAVATIEQMEAGNASSAQLKELAKFLKQGSCKSLTNSGKFEKEVLERMEEGYIHAAGGFEVVETYDAAGNAKYRAPIHFYVPCYKNYDKFEN